MLQLFKYIKLLYGIGTVKKLNLVHIINKQNKKQTSLKSFLIPI